MKLFIFLHCVGAVIGTTTKLERIPDYVRQLCPKSNVCDVNGYMGDKIGDPDSCCTDCSCRPDCSDKGNCCFVSRTHASEPSRIDVITPIVTTGDDRVQCLYPVTGKSEKSDYLNYISYNMLSSPNGKNVSNENRSCASKKVAPWGSLYPVYSKQTNKIYLNDICAQEYNVTDGVLWKAIFTCKSTSSRNTDIAEIFTFLEKGKVPVLCRIYFTYPGESTDLKSHVCYKDMIDQCSGVEFQVPSYLNATKEDISVACQSGLLSPYYSTFDLYANVFCFICSGLRFNANDRCENDRSLGDKNVAGNFVALLDPVAIAKMTNLIDNEPMACRINTDQNASNCRPVLCPFAQIRNANGNCVFPAKLWYQHLYSITIELRSEQEIDLKKAFHWHNNKMIVSDMQPLTLLNLMKLASWTIDGLLYESKQLDTGRTTNTLLVVLSRKFDASDPADIIRNMSLLMNTNWLLPYLNESLVLKPSQSKLKTLVYDFKQDLLTSGRFKVNDSDNEMYMSYKRLYTSFSSVQSSFMTKLYFCDQVELGIGEYNISTDNIVLYNTFSKMYLFNGEFALNYDNSGSVKICLENSGFVK